MDAGLQASHRNGVVAAGAFNAIDCPFYSTYSFVSIPPGTSARPQLPLIAILRGSDLACARVIRAGAFEGIIVRLRKQTVHADVSPTQVCVTDTLRRCLTCLFSLGCL